jgi:hypothetical protein
VPTNQGVGGPHRPSVEPVLCSQPTPLFADTGFPNSAIITAATAKQWRRSASGMTWEPVAVGAVAVLLDTNSLAGIFALTSSQHHRAVISSCRLTSTDD